MEIQEIKKRKIQLEKNIEEIVNIFESETKTNIDNIYISRLKQHYNGKEKTNKTIELTITI